MIRDTSATDRVLAATPTSQRKRLALLAAAAFAVVNRSVDSTNGQVVRDFLLKAESPAVSRALVARER